MQFHVLFSLSILINGLVVWPSLAQDASDENHRAIQLVGSKFDDEIDRRQDLSILRGKLPLKSQEFSSFQMIANTTKPSDLERVAIFEYAKMYEAYSAQIADADRRHVAQTSGVWRDAAYGLQRISSVETSQTLNALAQLYNSSISLGEFSKQKDQIKATSNESVQRLIGYLRAQSREEERQWKQRQQDREMAIQQQRQQQEREYEKNRTRITTCNRLGEYLFCQSR